jgi:hypothetical protein
MLSFLNKPFPRSETHGSHWRSALVTGTIVFAFLFIFRPFGMYRFETLQIAWITAGYGIITAFMVLLNVYLWAALFPEWFREEKWTTGKEILFILWIIFCIGLANAFYSVYIFNDTVSWSYLIRFQFFTILVSLIPVTVNVFTLQLVFTQRNLKAALELTGKMHHKQRLEASPGVEVLLQSENRKEEFRVAASDLIFITSADNYIEIHYLKADQEKKKLLRGTLKGARDDLRSLTAFYRCHRAFIVNLDRVISVTGNSQGYRLRLKGTDEEIPVSRNLKEELEMRLAK